MPIETSDYQEEPSSFRDIGSEFIENRAAVQEQIKAIRDQLINRDDRMTRIEKDIETVKNDLEKDIETVKCDFEKDILELKNNHTQLVNRLLWGIGIFVTSLVAIITALISTGKLKIM